MESETITLKCDNRDKWIDFVAKVKKERKTVWGVLDKLIDGYLKE